MQMLPYLLGQGVFGFVDGSNTCPSTHVLAHDGISLQVNPPFQTWKQQDQLILSALLSSLSMEVLHLVVGCQSSCSAWGTLERALASTSNSRIMQFHGSLQDLRQGDESVTQFMQKAKALFDELAAVGRPVSLEDFNLYVFRGLRGEFKDLVTSLITKAEPLSYADLHSHLLIHEFFHKSSAAIHAPLLPTPSIPSSALIAQRQTSTVAGVPTSPTVEATVLLALNLITAASKTPPSVAIGRALGSAIGDRIHAANCVRILAI
jgi:hypothetical protein